MKVGLQFYYFEWPGSPQNISSQIAKMAQTAEDVGFSSLWTMDHLFQLGRHRFGPSEITRFDGFMLEGYTLMSYLAAATQQVTVGLMVTGNFFRPPGLLIKMVTSLDVLSNGRAYLGIGAGWGAREARGFGIPFPDAVDERFQRFEETLQIAKHIWGGNQSPFQGKYHYLKEPINNPPPLSQPHPPILIGGDGERVLLRLIATYANALNFHIGGPVKGFPPRVHEWYQNREERLTRKLRKLKRVCKTIGRDYEEIERTVLATIKLGPNAMTSSELVDLCRELTDLDIQHVIFNMPNVHEITPIEIIGRDVIPQVSKL